MAMLVKLLVTRKYGMDSNLSIVLSIWMHAGRAFTFHHSLDFHIDSIVNFTVKSPAEIAEIQTD